VGNRCFFVRDSELQRVSLRRYQYSSQGTCPSTGYYHNASVHFQDVPTKYGPDGYCISSLELLPKDDARWQQVSKCAACDYVFTDQDEYQMFQETIYLDDNGKQWFVPRGGNPVESVGMMWDAWWMRRSRKPGEPNAPNLGPDGLCLHVVCPDGSPWNIDGRASNCDSPCKNCSRPYHIHQQQGYNCHYEDARPHKCWVRHGVPPNITVGKAGVTCGAGAGSILTHSGYHGFLRSGELVPC
jgi:hypothetical protein